MTYKGIAKGKMIELEQPLPYEEGQLITVSVEPVAGEPMVGSPEAIRKAMHRPPHLEPEWVDLMEQAIEQGRLPVIQEGAFDDEQ